MAEDTDENLVRHIADGDEDAARIFFRGHYPQVLRIVRNHRSVRHSEEDLCQMIFLKAFHNIGQYSGRMPVSHWLSRIAVNTCLNELKKDRRRQEHLEADLGEDAAQWFERISDPAVPQESATRAARELTQKLLQSLAPADRIIMAMLHIDGYSVAETSARTGFSQTGVKVRAFRARQKLHREFRHLLKEPIP